MSADRPDLAAELLAGRVPDVHPLALQAAVDVIAGQLHRDDAITLDQVRRLAKRFNDQRQFSLSRTISASWLSKPPWDATMNRLYAQSLLDLGDFDAAAAVLTDGLQRIRRDRGPDDEEAEHLGLLGRSYKERYLRTADSRWLEKSITQYYDAYTSSRGERYWHGINAVALLDRAARDKITINVGQSVEQLASEIFANVEARWKKNTADPWLAATASEALLALQRCEEAELFLYRFLNHSSATLFGIGSYTRQVREVWQGADDEGCAGRIFRIMSRHDARAGAWSTDIRTASKVRRDIESNPAAYEKNFLGENTFSVEAVRKLLACCHSIGCVHDADGRRMGTGFLLEGGDLNQRYAGKAVFITNAHVVGGDQAIPAAKATVTFELAEGNDAVPKHHRIESVLFLSPMGHFGVPRSDDEELDTAAALLQDVPHSAPCLKAAQRLPMVTAKTRAFVAGHPLGAGLQVSLHDSQLLDFDDYERLVHYRTPTDPGSSGSPVFNENWEVIALHHGGSRRMSRLHGNGDYEANEGIAIKAIQRKLAAI